MADPLSPTPTLASGTLAPAAVAPAGFAPVALAPVTSEGLLADRQRFWGTFTTFVTVGASGVAILLILLAYFLV